MWATFPMLREALDVIEAWGFSYKTVAFNWVKQNRNGTGIFMGLGNWTRSNSEICLLATKGKPKRISSSVAAYTAMLRDIDNQLERLDRMEMTMASPPGPDLTGMPRGSGTPSDRTGMMVERKMELEEQIDRLKAEEKQERNAIEGLILQLSDPDERAVIRLRYFDRADWESTCGVLFGDRRDYVDRVDAYQNRTYKIHGRALLNLAAVLDELEPMPELRQ